MRYGFILPYGDARTAAELAVLAEEHGWDGEGAAWIAAARRLERSEGPYDVVEGTTAGPGAPDVVRTWGRGGRNLVAAGRLVSGTGRRRRRERRPAPAGTFARPVGAASL